MIKSLFFIEDRERTLKDTKFLFFNTFWTVAFVSRLVIHYYDFLVLFALSS